MGVEVARWVAEKDLCLTGADTWAVEVVPNPDKGLAFPCHQELQTKLGIVNHENLVFDELIADKKYQFVFIFPPTPVKGATGSNGCPIAVT
jgi:kynurenine formamidase